MLLTNREMQRQIQAKIQNTATSTSNANDLLPKIKDWMNDRYHRIYRSHFWQETLEDYDLLLTASTDTYVFNRDVEPNRIITIFDKTNGKQIHESSHLEHVREDAEEMSKTNNILYDNPTRYRLIGVHTVEAEIGGTGEKLDVVSTDNTTDISPNCVRVYGLVSSAMIGENVTLTGTSDATTTNTFDANQKLQISVGTTDGTRPTKVGTITVTGDTSATVMAVIGADEYAHKYQWFKVSPTPKTSGTQPTWNIFYQKRFKRLVNDNDIPLFDCCSGIIQGCFVDALREDGLEQEASVAEQGWVATVKELMATRKSPYKIQQFKPTNREDQFINRDSYLWVP